MINWDDYLFFFSQAWLQITVFDTVTKPSKYYCNSNHDNSTRITTYLHLLVSHFISTNSLLTIRLQCRSVSSQNAQGAFPPRTLRERFLPERSRSVSSQNAQAVFPSEPLKQSFLPECSRSISSQNAQGAFPPRTLKEHFLPESSKGKSFLNAQRVNTS